MERLTPEELARIQETMGGTSQALAKTLQPSMENLQLLLKQWGEPLKKLQQPFLQLMRTRAEIRRIAEAFQECNLWLAPSMVGLTDEVVKLYYEGKRQVIPSIIARYYKRNNWAILRETVSKWKSNSFFRPRMGIIYDALEAHINGKYTLSVPAVLPHIEGIARDIIKKHNLPELPKTLICRETNYGKGGEKTLPSTVFGEVAISALSFQEWVAVESFLYYLEGTMYLSPRRTRKKLEDFAAKDILNRHSILHGSHLKYATSMNSLRCFLALDVLALIDTEEGMQS